MGLILFTERHANEIAGVLSCYDRMIVQGTLPVFCYAEGMTAYLDKRGIRIFDFAQFAKPLTDAIRANAHRNDGEGCDLVPHARSFDPHVILATFLGKKLHGKPKRAL
jgi:hypothetical protein